MGLLNIPLQGQDTPSQQSAVWTSIPLSCFGVHPVPLALSYLLCILFRWFHMLPSSGFLFLVTSLALDLEVPSHFYHVYLKSYLMYSICFFYMRQICFRSSALIYCLQSMNISDVAQMWLNYTFSAGVCQSDADRSEINKMLTKLNSRTFPLLGFQIGWRDLTVYCRACLQD